MSVSGGRKGTTVKPPNSDHIGDFWPLWRGWSLSEDKNVLTRESTFGDRISGN